MDDSTVDKQPGIPVVCLMGPTAAGKTALSLDIADQFDCEIISVDSALIYRDMDIGTAKPDESVLQKYPHHLVNILTPTESYSVASFCESARQCIADIHTRGRIPLLVGGTMLYFNALEHGLAVLPPSNPAIRNALEKDRTVHGLEKLHNDLSNVDPDSAQRIHKNDTQRILRALEVWKISGRTLGEHYDEQDGSKQDNLHSLKLCVNCSDRSVLHERIATRFDQMLTGGFVDEVVSLRNKYHSLTLDMPSMRCVGYRQVWQFLQGELDEKSMREKGIVATRQLAKRQLTWLRGMENVQWFESGCATDEILSRVDAFLECHPRNTLQG